MNHDIKAMTNQDLLERHNELAKLMGEDSDSGLSDSYNRRYQQRKIILDELRSRGALDVLLPNLRHENRWVRYLSAVICWDLAPSEAEATLEELRVLHSAVGLAAGMSLYTRRSGILDRYPAAKGSSNS